MQDNIQIYEEERPWGRFRKFTENTPSTVKIITVKPDCKLSLQSHNKRKEFWRVIEGSGIFEIDNKKYEVKIGDEQYVPLGVLHRISAGDNGLSIIEIATGEFDENDIIRYEDDYGRI